MRYFFLTIFQMNLLATVVFMMIQFQRVLFKNSTSSWWCRQYKIVVLLFLLPVHRLFSTYLSQLQQVSQNIGNYHKTSDDFANLIDFAPYLWIIGVIVLGGYQIIAYFKFKSLFSVADLVSDKNLLNLLSNEKSKFNYYYDIPLYSWSILDTPIVVGVVQPKLIITENKLSNESYQQVFSHEINHIKSCDNFWKLLTKIMIILHFYNPIVYWFAKKFVEEMEFTCDENVVKDLSFSQKKTYCLTLIESVSVVNNTINLSSSFSPNKKSLQQRLTNIMKYKQMRTTTKVISSFILICVTYIMLLFTSFNSVLATNKGEYSSFDDNSVIGEVVDLNFSDDVILFEEHNFSFDAFDESEPKNYLDIIEKNAGYKDLWTIEFEKEKRETLNNFFDKIYTTQ